MCYKKVWYINSLTEDIMRVYKLNSIKPGNPFREDQYHMGTVLGDNLVVMYKNFPKDKCPYLIIINTTTGERLKVNLDEENNNKINEQET